MLRKYCCQLSGLPVIVFYISKVSSIEAIQDVLKNWDISITDSLKDKMEIEKDKRREEDQKRKKAEASK